MLNQNAQKAISELITMFCGTSPADCKPLEIIKGELYRWRPYWSISALYKFKALEIEAWVKFPGQLSGRNPGIILKGPWEACNVFPLFKLIIKTLRHAPCIQLLSEDPQPSDMTKELFFSPEVETASTDDEELVIDCSDLPEPEVRTSGYLQAVPDSDEPVADVTDERLNDVVELPERLPVGEWIKDPAHNPLEAEQSDDPVDPVPCVDPIKLPEYNLTSEQEKELLSGTGIKLEQTQEDPPEKAKKVRGRPPKENSTSKPKKTKRGKNKRTKKEN